MKENFQVSISPLFTLENYQFYHKHEFTYKLLFKVRFFPKWWKYFNYCNITRDWNIISFRGPFLFGEDFRNRRYAETHQCCKYEEKLTRASVSKRRIYNDMGENCMYILSRVLFYKPYNMRNHACSPPPPYMPSRPVFYKKMYRKKSKKQVKNKSE